MSVGGKPASSLAEVDNSSNPSPGFFRGIFVRFGKWLGGLLDRPVPPELLADPDSARRAQLVARFGLLGALAGIFYATFYLFIGHKWGAAILLVSSIGWGSTPFVMRQKKSIEPAADILALSLTLGFTSLCFVEGGLHGHAIAWLVSVPLCTLLLAGQKVATRWTIIAFLAAGTVADLDLKGITLPTLYDPKWYSLVSAAGYMSLIVFLFILGLVFEYGRAQAFAKMQSTMKELSATNERLVLVNSEKNEFLGIAAHDLKNPLTAIVGSAEMLKETSNPADVTQLATVIVSASKRMRDLIANLLDVNAIEQGAFISNLEHCDINKLVEQSVQSNQPAATRKDIAFRIGTSEGLTAKADRKATLQILDNLISNAVKYSPPNTTIHVHTLPEKNHALVTVRDEGPGISEADQKKLFQKFSRLSARPTGGESSTGLGLAIVKKLAEAMSGSVQCHSKLGSGATFTLRLPSSPVLKVPEQPPVKPRIHSRISELLPDLRLHN